MGLSRRGSSRGEAPIWPGFVDAMTSLLMVLIFVLTIFMIVQFVLRETITTQSSELTQLNSQISGLADALGLEKKKNADLTDTLNTAKTKAQQQDLLIASLNSQLSDSQSNLKAAQTKITGFEAQVAGLLADKAAAATAADLAAARAAALRALVASLKAQNAGKDTQLAAAQEQLSAAEKKRLADAAAEQMLRDKLRGAQDEITAMTLALEAQRKKAEDTLTLLAAAEAAKKDLNTQLAAAEAAKLAAQNTADTQLSEAEKRAVLLAAANQALSTEQAKSADAMRKMTLLNQQISALRSQLASLQGVLDAAEAKDSANKVQIQSLGNKLNAALAQVAVEEKKRLAAETEARKLAEEKAKNLEQYRSEFFGKLRKVLAGQPGVRIVGDRFVFSSEVLFKSASADLSPEGQQQIADVTQTLLQIANEIPTNINWILEVDGFTDNVPLAPGAQFADNWALSQARALSVVHYMINNLGFPAERLKAAGFGQYQPVAAGDTPQARAQNRRIELKLTER